jgi:UDP-GlcNAc3NAcA epimerase
MKIVTVLGARPHFIKAAPVCRALAKAGLAEVMVHTGQHYDAAMSDVFFEELGLPKPAYNLGIGSGSHGEQTGRMLPAVEAVLLKEKPSVVLVYGDTNSSLAGALTAAKLNVPVAHVEAGVRSFNRRMPEETNRVIIDALSTYLFAPTDDAIKNLQHAEVAPNRIYLVGDVMYDTTLMFAERARQKSSVLERLKLTSKRYALSTIHRADTTQDQNILKQIFIGLTDTCLDIPVVLPLHPRTASVIGLELKEEFRKAGGILIEPVGYLDMLRLEQEAGLVLTDSGGVQKEAFWQGVYCITLRDQTEWVELVEAGWNTLLPPSRAASLRQVAREVVGKRGRAIQPYGDGRASERIAEILGKGPNP